MLDQLTIEQAAHTSGEAPIIVALSGGGDSVALLGLMRAHFGGERLRALVVDHALREGSNDDARRAQGFADKIGVAAEVLTVSWPDGVKRSQAAARAARYAIICERARELGARVIACAHTADDQIETILMRAAQGSSWRGLAGMTGFAPVPVWPEGRGMWLARPLINERRAWLRNYLGAEGAAWIEDPANSNTAFERVRVRAYLAELEAGGADVVRLALLAARIRPHVAALDRAAAAYLSAGAQFEGPAIFVDRSAWSAPVPPPVQELSIPASAPASIPEHVRRRALSALITAAAGALREPPADAIERLDARMQAGDFRGASLGGATIAVKGARLRIDRDWGALHGRADGAPGAQRLALTPHHLTVWDGRLELCVGETGWSVGPARGGVELQCAGKAEALAPLIVEKKARWLLRQRVAHLLGEHD